MPWSPASFKKKHNHSLTKEEARIAAKAANDALHDGKSEASAIRLANYIIEQRRKAHKHGH